MIKKFLLISAFIIFAVSCSGKNDTKEVVTNPSEISNFLKKYDGRYYHEHEFTNGSYTENILEFKELKLDLNSRKVSVGDKEVVLQGKQFDMLEYLIGSKNIIVTKDQIFDKIWGFDSETSTNVIEVYASGLRKELKKLGYEKYLKTIRGVGYIWSE